MKKRGKHEKREIPSKLVTQQGRPVRLRHFTHLTEDEFERYLASSRLPVLFRFRRRRRVPPQDA